MPSIKESAIDAFKAAVQQVAQDYINKSDRTIIRAVKKYAGYTADAHATLIVGNTATGRDFLAFFKAQVDSLNSSNSLLTDLIALLPQILQRDVGEPQPANEQQLYFDFCQALSQLSAPQLVSKLQIEVDDTSLTASVSSGSLSTNMCSPYSVMTDNASEKASVGGFFYEASPSPVVPEAVVTPVPSKLHCPITLDEMEHPVRGADGQIYEGVVLMNYLRGKGWAADSPVEARWTLSSGVVRPAVVLTGVALTPVPEAVGNPQDFTDLIANYKGVQGYQPGSDMFTYYFLGGELLKIEIGSNFINVYENSANTDIYKRVFNMDLVSRIVDNYEVNDNIQRLAGAHHQDEFSICQDHHDLSYANPVFRKTNQSSQRDHFHPTPSHAGHMHLVYGWDAVSVQDIVALFSYVTRLDPTAIKHSEVVKLSGDYLKFMAAQMLPLCVNATANADVVNLLRSIQNPPAVFEADGRLSPVIAAKLNLIAAQDLVGLRDIFQNDRLHQSFTVMLADLQAIAQDPSRLMFKASDFSCNPPSSAMPNLSSQYSTASSPGNMQVSGPKSIVLDLDMLQFLLSQNGPNH